VTLALTDKKQIVAQVSEVASDAISAVVAEYRGLTVADMTELRTQARASGIYLRVVRNTLLRRAFAETRFACLSTILKGPLFVALSLDSPGAAARLLRDFAKHHKHLKVMGLALDGQLLGPEHLKRVASLPTKEEALAKLLFKYSSDDIGEISDGGETKI
jgi:large subunit ribosomal protein L10